MEKINPFICLICKLDFNDEENLPMLLPCCGYSFCISCVTEKHKDTQVQCPNCQKNNPVLVIKQDLLINRALLEAQEFAQEQMEIEIKEKEKIERQRHCQLHTEEQETFFCVKCYCFCCQQCILQHLGDQQKHFLISADKDYLVELSSLANEYIQSINGTQNKQLLVNMGQILQFVNEINKCPSEFKSAKELEDLINYQQQVDLKDQKIEVQKMPLIKDIIQNTFKQRQQVQKIMQDGKQ